MNDDKIDYEKIRKAYNKMPKTRYDTFGTDLYSFITSILKNYNVPEHITLEITQYATSQMLIVVNDETYKAIRETDRRCRKIYFGKK